jgi:hypothetical protein
MSIFYSHRERFCDPASERRSPATSLTRTVARRLHLLARQAMGRAGAVLGIIHRGIITAKMRRLQRELLFHGGVRDDGSVERRLHDVSGPDHDAAEFAQRPLLLGDKWDF